MRFKSYDDFVNEGFLDTVKSAIKKIGEFFSGIGSWFLNTLVFQKNKELPTGVKVYPTDGDIKLMADNGVSISRPSIPALKESFDSLPTNNWLLYEDVISTKYPDLGKVPDVDSKELRNSLRDAIEGGINVKPLLVWGAPGIGKTAIINAIAQEYFGGSAKSQRRMIDFDLMTMSPEDFFMPTVTDKENPDKARKGSVPDAWLPVRPIDKPEMEKEINGPDGKGGILFFDEIARCNPKVQNVCLKLIDERKIGNYVLGDKWVILCAANRKSDLSDDEQQAFHWSSTLANRFQQVNYATTFDDWAPWATTAKNELGEMLVDPTIVAFLRFNQKYFHMLDPEQFSMSSGGSEAWPSPRTWTNAAAAIKQREKRYEKNGWKDMDDPTKKISQAQWEKEQLGILERSVGADAASAFMGFKKLMEKFDPKDIEKVYTDGAKAPKWKELTLDETYALISAACFLKRDAKTLDKKEMENFTTWLVDSKDAPNSIKAIKLLTEVVPALEDPNSDAYEFWQKECKNRFTDAFPTIFSKSK
jgi:hypothetical protein